MLNINSSLPLKTGSTALGPTLQTAQFQEFWGGLSLQPELWNEVVMEGYSQPAKDMFHEHQKTCEFVSH